MGLFKLLMVYVCLVMVVLQSVESAVFIRLDRVPRARTRHSTAVFQYSVTDQHAQNPCRNHECSFYCEVICFLYPFLFCGGVGLVIICLCFICSMLTALDYAHMVRCFIRLF